MEQKLGRYLLPGEVVDHIDRNRSNNAPENLQLYSSTGSHIRDHFTARNQVLKLKAELARYKERYGELDDE